MRRLTLQLEGYRGSPLRKEGFWQCAALAVALAPMVAWAWTALAPAAPPPATPAPEPLAPLSLQALTRRPLDADWLAVISADNLFTPSRQDWALAAAPVEESNDDAAARARAEERRKQAEQELEKFTFVATIRSGDVWSALADHPDRKPGDDLLTIRVGDAYKSWSATSITRDSLTLAFDDQSRTIALGPRIAASKQGPTPPSGRSKVEAREAPAGSVIIDPPIEREEAKRRLLESLAPGEERVRRLVDELLDSMNNDRGERPPQSRPSQAKPPAGASEKPS